jgi:perosamine synthetase
VKDCLDTGWVSSAGSYVERFEREFAGAVAVPYAVACATGTAALHIALLISGVQPDDEVVLPALTFIAPANAVRYLGAWPTFVDVEPDYWQIDCSQIEAFLREDCSASRGTLQNRHTGRRVSAILAVDILGHPCDLDCVHELAETFGLIVVEDATESLGARYRGRSVGSTSRLAAFSFNGNKLLTTGGGGMLVTADASLADRARYLTTQAKDDAVECIHGSVGYNYRLTNVQAAIGCAQLEQLDEFVEAKRWIARRYDIGLGTVPGLSPMQQAPWARSVYWMYTIRVDASRTAIDSRDLLHALRAELIETRPLWQPLHGSPAHRASFARACPVADTLHRETLSLPCSTGLTEHQQDRVIDAIRRRCGL